MPDGRLTPADKLKLELQHTLLSTHVYGQSLLNTCQKGGSRRWRLGHTETMSTANQTLKGDAHSPGASLSQQLLGRVARRVERWRAALQVLVPAGYEDDTGFHFGVDPTASGQSQDNAV